MAAPATSVTVTAPAAGWIRVRDRCSLSLSGGRPSSGPGQPTGPGLRAPARLGASRCKSCRPAHTQTASGGRAPFCAPSHALITRTRTSAGRLRAHHVRGHEPAGTRRRARARARSRPERPPLRHRLAGAPPAPPLRRLQACKPLANGMDDQRAGDAGAAPTYSGHPGDM